MTRLGSRWRLSWKLFASYVAVIVVGTVVLATAVSLTATGAFDRHLAMMAARMGGRDPGMMERELFAAYRSATTEALLLAVAAAGIAAIVTSYLMSRQVSAPLSDLARMSRAIAAGNYQRRLDVPPGEEVRDEIVQLTREFNRMAAALDDTERRRRELIGDVSHELRTPIASLRSMSEAMAAGALPADERNLQQIINEASRLERLARDLQELSRVEATTNLALAPQALAPLVESVCQRLRAQFDDKQVQLQLDIPAALPLAQVDADRMTQVLINLIGNALQYTPTGGSVQVRLQPTQKGVSVAITDTGIGIAAEHLPHLFTRFYRVDKSRSRLSGGSGIGLSIAHHLVAAHGGVLEASSDGPGRGSVFRFMVPAA